MEFLNRDAGGWLEPPEPSHVCEDNDYECCEDGECPPGCNCADRRREDDPDRLYDEMMDRRDDRLRAMAEGSET